MTFADALFVSDLIQFKLGSGQVLTRLTSKVRYPPVIAVAWRIGDGDWQHDLGGQWIETGKGSMVWEPAKNKR